MIEQEVPLSLMPNELRGPRVLLRAARDTDADEFVRATIESVATVGRWMGWARPDYTLEDALAWIAFCREARSGGEAYEVVICDPTDGRLLGGCGLNNIDRLHRRANLGYWIRASAEGRGLASSAAETLARAALRDGGLVRIEIVADVRNVGSQRVAEKIGAVKEGVLRSRIQLRGEAHDAIGYSLIAQDLRS